MKHLALGAGLALLSACSADDSTGSESAEGGDAGGMPSLDGGNRSLEGGMPSFSDPTYETLPALARGARQEHAVVALQGRVCVIGGFAPGITDSVECYDPSARSWSLIASVPEGLHHANAAVVGEKIYLLGYLYDLGFTPTRQSYAYEPANDSWSELAPMPASRQRGSAGVAVLGTDIYVIGGAQGSPVSYVDIYDTEADTWREGPDLPAAREHMCAGSIGDLIVVAGGRAGGIGGHTDGVLTLSPGASTWSERTPMPTSRGGCAGATLGGRFHVFGGEGNPAAASGVFAEAEAYDPETDAWSELPDMPIPRHGFGAATLGDRIYLPGGATTQAFGAVADFEVFFYD